MYILIAFYVLAGFADTEHLALRNQGAIAPPRFINEWAIKLAEDGDPHQIALEHGFKYIPTEGLPRGYFKFSADSTRDMAEHRRNVARMEAHPHVHQVEQQVLRKRYKRVAPLPVHVASPPEDPMWPQSWHLSGNPMSLEPQSQWAQGIDGSGVTLAIVDDGLDHQHNDVKDRYSEESSHDFNDDDEDPRSLLGADTHGTKAAGCAGAASNAYCGLGVAPMVNLAGIRLISYDTTDLQEAQGLSYRTDINDIYSNSWGPVDDGNRLEGAGPVLMAAFKQSVEEGRGGKGSVYVWASGNGRGRKDTCNYDGYANSRYTIPIGALTQGGKFQYYSEGCAALFAMVPSGAIRTINVNQRCVSSFGGTSAASPIAAGILALVLQKRPDLTWRDVQHVVAKSAIKVDPTRAGWWNNGGGYHHSNDYGFGRLDVNRTVFAAAVHQLVPASVMVDTDWVDANTPIPDTQELVSVSRVIQDSGIDFVEHVDLYVRGQHTTRGDVEIQLVSPFGTHSVLQEKHGDRHEGWTESGWRYGSVRNWGENADGEWKITLQDMVVGNGQGSIGSLDAYRLVIYGFKRPPRGWQPPDAGDFPM